MPYSSDLVRILSTSTGELARTFGVSTQDITPYGNNLYHLNSIVQPATATSAPVVGVAITAETAVPGSGTGVSHEVDIAQAATFAIEIAKEFSVGTASFYDQEEFDKLITLYGKMNHLQTLGETEEN